MRSGQSFGERTPARRRTCAVLAVVAALAVGSTTLALAQAPGAGWVQLPGGGWVPGDHPLAQQSPPPVPAACDQQTLRGSYLFNASGFNIGADGALPKAIVEAIDFNGDGTLGVPAATVSINGTISRSSGGVGTYTLDAECRGTVTFTPGPSFDIFVDRNGKQAWMIQINANSVFQGSVTKVSN
jgi:hypothetical protein